MKRASIAETTLDKQIKLIYDRVTLLDGEIKHLEVMKKTLSETAQQLTAERLTLKDARIKASESRK